MKEKIVQAGDTVKSFWTSRSKGQKGIFIGSIAIVIALIVGIVLLTTNTKMVPLYNNLSLQEVGQIKAELDTRGVPYEIKDGGKSIVVPEEQVDTLLVDLAAEGIPSSGNIDYSYFSENASWGITDNEFSMIKLDAMQTELEDLIKEIEGINDAKVMINMPKDPVFVSDTEQEASASIVINTKPGYQFQGNQIDILYRLVSKAVPNLPPENIVIMNQYFEYFDRETQYINNSSNAYAYQQQVKKDIERDIRRRVQQMLGAIVGPENVIVSVTSDIDFTKENRVEKLVEPVNLENMEGLPVSIETVHETYSGDNPPVGGVPGTGDGDIPNYQATEDGENGEYELVKETVNNEYNRIRKEIVESPYKIRDLGIQVVVDSVKSKNGNDIQYLTAQEEEAVRSGIESILNSIITTSVNKEYGDVQSQEGISIVFQEFNGSNAFPKVEAPVIPVWVYIAGGLLLIIIIVLLVMLFKRRKDNREEFLEETVPTESEPKTEVPKIGDEPDSEAVVRRKQLEKMAKEKPEDFAKILRSWITDD